MEKLTPLENTTAFYITEEQHTEIENRLELIKGYINRLKQYKTYPQKLEEVIPKLAKSVDEILTIVDNAAKNQPYAVR